ncbi:hypothetical protein N9V13_04895 [Betaproteobacteria bacterium]|nr:hypothetical protein [Betaproteobacteria bacterium]
MKVHLFFFSVFVFSSAFAMDWQKVHESDGKSFYVDIANIKKQDKFIYYSELIDFEEAIYGALSRISTFKANCATMERANTSITSYTGQMGKYIVINEAKNDGKRFIKDSQSSTLKFACARIM